VVQPIAAPAVAPPLEREPVAIAAPVPVMRKATAAPLPLDQLLPLLESAGMMLTQTDADKHALIQARIAAEPRVPRTPRVRPELPPLDVGPLVQVETRGTPATPPV
jgi:hypothetical protein